MRYPLYFITGAPGAGKSTAVEAFIKHQSDYLAFDIDWLADAASSLANKSIYTDPTTWQPYSVLWFEILHMAYKNGKTPVFFTPNDPQDIARYGQPNWCHKIYWLLLDCDDQTRRTRLLRRSNWTETMVTEAISDAEALRHAISEHLNTSQLSPLEVATSILAWLEHSKV